MQFVQDVADGKRNVEELIKDHVFKAVIEYAGQFYYQASNFQGYGDTKFVPRCSYEELLAFVKQHDMPKCVPLVEKVQQTMWSLSAPIIAFPPEG